jgi:phytoene dehydrogenase-like protein
VSGRELDAVVVGAGPNGLAAAIVLAEAGLSVKVFERSSTVGGGSRTAELTLPGFQHDVCSAIHPLALASPFFKKLDLATLGVDWIEPQVLLAHPLDDGSAATLMPSVQETAASLGIDGHRYERLISPVVRNIDKIIEETFGKVFVPSHPVAMARFGVRAIRSAAGMAGALFEDERARALLPGISAHAIVPLTQPATASFGLMFAAVGHAYGWPLAAGGSQAVADAMAARLKNLGGDIETDREVRSLADLPPARARVFDVTPKQLMAICGEALPASYRRRLGRFRYGPGIFKADWALSGPIPWKAQECASAGTVHLGGTLDEIVASEAAVAVGRYPEMPYMVTAQQSLFDPSRAPGDNHTYWAYCHVPNGSTVDMTQAMENQIERFAPGFRDLVIERRTMDPAEMERHDPNYVGGDINGGSAELRQLFTRPVVSLDPYATPARGIFMCSSSTPPGGGVHGMCGHNAALSVLKQLGAT